jgi:hypothetical protein
VSDEQRQRRELVIAGAVGGLVMFVLAAFVLLLLNWIGGR